VRITHFETALFCWLQKLQSNVKVCHPEHAKDLVDALKLLDYEPTFAPTQKRIRVFRKWDKILRFFASLRMTAWNATFLRTRHGRNGGGVSFSYHLNYRFLHFKRSFSRALDKLVIAKKSV